MTGGGRRSGAAVREDARVHRIGLVVHPRREIDSALEAVRRWASAHDVEIVQVAVNGLEREIAEVGDASSVDLVLAVGGDGTALAALHAAAAAGKPVLGIACGSLGALTATGADELDDALDRMLAGDWRAKRLPGLEVAGGGESQVAINDLVVVRQGPSQIAVEIRVDGHRYIRFAGDGLVVATPLGSSAYTMASGGPILTTNSEGFVLTPLAPHGGCCPPLVVGSSTEVEILVEAGYYGARLEFDGHAVDVHPEQMTVTRRERHATLVALGDDEPMLDGLRRRRVLIDSPRMLARDERLALGGRDG